MAYFDTTWYVNFGDGSTTGYYAVAKRPQNAAVAAGQLVRQFTAPSVGNERVFVCIIAGTTANVTDATWVLSRGAKTTDGTATWMECTGIAAVNGDVVNNANWTAAKAIGGLSTLGAIIKRNNGASYQIVTTSGSLGAAEPAFSDTAGVTTTETAGTGVWTSLGPVSNFTGGQAPHARLANALALNWFSSGNTVYVGDNHAETQASTITMSPTSALLAKILCHNHSGNYPPAASDITTGATLTTTGSANITFTGQGSFYFYGLTFVANGTVTIGAGAVGQTQNWFYFDSCSWQLSTASGSSMQLGASSTAWGVIVFNNTTVKFGNVAHFISPYFCSLTWQNTGQILASGSSVPATFFQTTTTGRFSSVMLNNLDLSQLTGSLVNNTSPSIGTLVVQDCKLNASMTVTTPINTGMNVQLIRSDSAGTSYKSTRYAYEGTETTETSIVRTGGAVDPLGQAQSRKIATSANAQWLRPFKAEPMVVWNAVTGTNRAVTVCGTVNAGALPNNDDLWLEVEYLGSATDPLGKIITTSKASVLASNAAVASDSSVWNNLPVVTFDSATTVNTTLSGGNLTATHSNTSNASGASVVAALNSGKFYFEVTQTTTGHGANDTIAALIPLPANFTNINAAVAGACAVRGGQINANNASTGKTIGTFAAGDVCGAAVDLDARLVWFRRNAGTWNNDGTANPVTGVGGVAITSTAPLVPGVGFSGSGTLATDSYTANFGATSYANAAPSGFANWGTYTPFKLTATLSSPQPQLAGYLHARVRAAKASATYYIDPMVVLT